MCVFLTWLAEAKLSFRAEYDSFNCIRSLNRKITRECAVNPLHRNSEGIIIHGKCMLIWIRGDCFHLQTTQSHQLICTTLDNLVTCRFAFLFWQGTYGNGDRSKQKKKKRVEALQQCEVARVWTRIETGEQKKKKSPKQPERR